MDFPYGKAPLAILILAIITAVGMLLASASPRSRHEAQPNHTTLVYATFTKEHASVYQTELPAFEKQNNCTIQLQVVDQRALQSRLQSALQVGAPVPDMVEIMDPTQGIFFKGPLEDIGFLDLTDRIHNSGLYDKLVQSRFARYTSRGRIFALPHDVHPMMLAYRRDIVEDQLHIDVSKLTTWDEFTRVGREVTKDYDGDGVIDHYMLDLPTGEIWGVKSLLLQHGGGMFDEKGNVIFDSEQAVDTICWYVHQVSGKDRIAFGCGWGQTLAKAMMDGLCLFYLCPDWRTAQFQMDVPSVAGKMALMPLPAWEPGGLRTSTWGGTGLAITKQCKNPDLAWKLAMYLYYDPKLLGPRFEKMNILPPYRPAWTLPQIDEPRAFWSNIKLGRVYANLADQVPEEPASPYMQSAEGKLQEAFSNTLLYFQAHGDDGLRQFARRELKRCADSLRTVINRNVFLNQDTVAAASDSDAGGKAQ